MLAVTANLLVAATGCTREIASVLERHLSDACLRFEITTGRRLAYFLATVGHESQNFEHRVENLNYSSIQRIRAVWPARTKHLDDATIRPWVHNPPALGNAMYGDRGGNRGPNDGWRYRGRGLIGVTFLDNYREVTRLVREAGLACPDFVNDPDALAEPRWAVMSAGALWHEWDCNELSDAGEFGKVSARVNVGDARKVAQVVGMPDRETRRAKATAALQGVA